MSEPPTDPLLAGALTRVMARLEAPDGMPTRRHASGGEQAEAYEFGTRYHTTLATVPAATLTDGAHE